MEKLQLELSKIGIIKALEHGYVFTLLLVKDKERFNAKRTLEVMDLVTEYFDKTKPFLETIVTETDFILIVLKP